MSELYTKVCIDCANKHIVPIKGRVRVGSMRCHWCGGTRKFNLYHAVKQIQVKLTYFKPNGKFYTQGDFWMKGEGVRLDEIFDLVEQKAIAYKLPGLKEGHSDFVVLVDVPHHPHNHPHLINTEAVLMQAKKRLVSLQPSKSNFRQGW